LSADTNSGRRRRSGALAYKHAANMRARALSAVIQDIRTAGFISYNAVARELNRRGVPTLRHGKRWYPMTVSRLLVRLSKMKPWRRCSRLRLTRRRRSRQSRREKQAKRLAKLGVGKMPRVQRLVAMDSGAVNPEKHEIHFTLKVSDAPPITLIARYGPAA
jgi:hypothetical protein